MLFESKFFGALRRKVDIGSNLDIGYFGICQSSDQFIRIIHFCILTTWNVPFGAGVSAILTAL